MNLDRWKKIEDIFQAALDLKQDERDEFIRARCGDDDDLRREIEKLVARFEAEEDFLESPIWTDSKVWGNTLKSGVASSLENEVKPHLTNELFIGRKIGVYLLKEQVGRGGMGVVYAAERVDGEFQQKVAVKLIKRGMDSDFIIRRFRHERQILANLDHPNIARLFDGGTTDDGLPYFIMEFIKGEPILKYCREKNLDLRQRLELFLQVCNPIIYAHQRKIIHRDIKPSNILVTDEGVPKLLDFGIAKILDTDSIHESLLPTATAMRLMTPEYASPEQVKGEEITTATDQYSLGILLYELVTGERPYQFSSRSPHEIARVICEEPPSEPSSAGFRTEHNFPFDGNKLDRIILKTLRKNPAERYTSIEELADDIKRFLRNENVHAESSIENRVIENKAVSENYVDYPIVENDAISPRWRGVKQGIFISVLSLILIPLMVSLVVTGFLEVPLAFVSFFLIFLSGLIRILYALFFEAGKAKTVSNIQAGKVNQAETKLINDRLLPETIIGNSSTAEKTAEEEKTIAILPFKYLNPIGETDTGSEFLSLGLADALITRLSNVRQFIVRPTSSILKFGRGEADLVKIGKELKVRFIVSGNLAKSDNRMRVSVQVLDVENRATVWAERFEEDFKDYLDLEDSISEKVVESLLPRLTGEERQQLNKRGTDNPAAFEAYLRGRFYLNSFTEDGFAKALVAFNEAIAKDKNYALAYAGIADYYIWLGVYGIVPPQECYPPAIKAAQRAIVIDGELVEAYAALGFARLCGEFDWENAEKNCLRAIEINPHYTLARLWYSYVLQSAGRFDEGIEQAKKAIEFDPLTYVNQHVLAWAYYFARRFDEAITQIEKTIQKFPLVGLGEFTHSWFLRYLDRTEAALDASNKAQALSGDSLFVLLGHVQALAKAGQKAETEKLLHQIFEEGRQKYLSYYQVALIYLYLNEKEKALDALERADTDDEGWLIWLGTEPGLDSLRGEERFQKLLEKVNHPLANQQTFKAQGKEINSSNP